MSQRWKFFMLMVCVVVFAAGCQMNKNTNTTVPYNENESVTNNENTAQAEQEDIIYGTDMDPAVVEASRQDCAERGGVFDECGSACTDPSKMCIAACALRCDF
jgi:hypothetical protein